MTKHNKKHKRNYQYSHAFADLPLTYQKALKSAIMDMVVSVNSELQTHRQISPYSAVIVASRSLQASSSRTKPAARVFAAIRAVNSFINLSRTGKPGVERLSNTDLLPVAHPLSTRAHAMTETSLRIARAQWLAADPRIDDSLRNLVAAAYSQTPGSVEHRHAFTRISVLPVGAIPRDVRIDADLQLTPIIAVLGLGGNSDAARSLRAKLQRRDRYGRFAEMGGGWSFKLRLPDGLFKTVSGRVVGASGTDAIEIEVTGSKDLDDGIYTMPSANGESVKAVLPTKAVEKLPDRDDAMDDVYVDSASLTRKDAPSGWKQLGKTRQVGRTSYSEYTSDDGYTVKREARPNAAGTGVDYGYSVRRMEATDTDPFAKDKKVMRSWSEVQKAVLADQDDYKRDLEALESGSKTSEAPAGGPGELKEPPSDVTPSSTEAVDISNILDKYKKMPKTSLEEKTKAAAYLTEEFTKLQRKNNRAKFMYKGKERDVEITYAGVYESKYARAAGNAKLLGFDRNAGGERSFFYNEIEPLTGEPPANSVDKHELRQRGDSNVYDYGDGIIINSPEAGVRVESKYNTPIYSIDSPLPPLKSIEDAKRAIEDWEANRTDRTNERMSDAIGWMIKNNRDAKKAGKTGAQSWKSDVAKFVANFVAPIDSKKYKDEFGKLKERLDSGELSWADGLVEAEQIVLRLREKGSVPKRTPQEWKEWAKRRHFPGATENNRLIDEAAAKAAAASEPPAGEPDDYGKSQEVVSELTEALEEKGVDVGSLTNDMLDYLNDQASQIENGETSVEDAANAFVDRWGDELDLPTAAPGEPDGPGADDDEVDDFDPYRFIERRLKLLKAVGDHNQGALGDDEFNELFDEIMDETGSLAPFSTSERMELLRLRDEYEDEMERVQATKDEDYDDDVDGKEEAINEVANNFYNAVADIVDREKPLDGGPGEPPTGGPGEPPSTSPEAPSTPETNDPVDQSLFDETFITSDDSYKLNVFEQYNPRGRVDQDSVDYTDDPQILANSFTAENLQKALRQALVPSSDGDVATGLGYLPFDGGDEAVPAEALYEALDFAGIDSDIVVAGIYDSVLPEGSETNVERITMQRDDLDKIGGEDFNPADINTARDWEIKQAIKRNGELATPQRASLAVAQMTEAAENEEINSSIKQVADDLVNRQNDPNLNEYSAENLGNALDSYMSWSFSDSADEREAFRGFWGMLMSIDGGSTNDMDDKRPVQSTSGFRRAVYESVKRQVGGDEEAALAEYNRLISEYGGYPEWTRGKEAISDGDTNIFADQSSAGAFFRLIAASAEKNDVRLHRYIDVRKDDPVLEQYFTPGVILPIDARSFTTRNEAAEDIVSLIKYAPNSETTHVVFELQPGDGTSISFASVSWFSGEAEHIAWGNYEVASTRRVEMGGRTDLTVVSLRQVAVPNPDAGDGAIDSDIFGPGDDAAVDVPAKPNVANWDKVGPQLGSNLGGTYEDPDGDIYYVKESKSLKHAENEALASAFYKELGVNAVDVRVGEADGAPRTVSPIISTTGETLADRLNDGEFIDKIREDFAIDAWLGNYDVAGLVYDNIVVDNDGNPLRVDPGGALLFRARGAEKGDMFGDSVGEIDTLTDPDINPSASRVFGGMTEEQRKASAQKLLDITPQRIDQIVDSIVTDPGMAEGLKDRLKKRRADVLNRFDIEDSVLNMPEVAQRPTAPTDKSPESIEAFKDELARFVMDKTIAKGWNCEGGLTSAATNPCDLPSVNELIAEAKPTDAELAEPVARQLPSDEEVNNAFDVIFDDIETYLSSDWGLDGSDKSKYKKTRSKIEDIRERYDAGEITREEAAAELAALRDEISASGGEPIAKEATAEGIDQIIKNLDGTIYDPVVVIDKDLPPPGSGLGLSKDKVTLVKPGMTVRSKDGVTYVVHRYDPSNWNYVYVKPTDGSKEKIKSTKTLEIVGGEGGGGGTPTAPEPSGPELPKADAPKGAPKAPETPSAVEKPEVPFPDDMPLAPRAPEPPKSKKDKQQGVVGPGAEPVIIEEALPYTSSGIPGTPSLADAFAFVASDEPNAAIVGSYAAIDSTDIEDMSVRVTRLRSLETSEQFTRMKFKLTAWAGEKLYKDVEDLKRNEYTITNGVALKEISRANRAVPALKPDTNVYDNWRHGTTYEAKLPNGVKIQFFRGAQGSYTDHVFSRSVEDYDEVVNALNNYVIIDVPDGVSLDSVRAALNVAGVVDPRPSVEQDFRVLIENRLMSVLGGKTNASRNEARPEVRQEILSEVKTKYGIGVEDVYVGIGANGRIEMRVSKEKAAALAKEAKIEIAEHNLTVSAGYRPDPEIAATKIANIIFGPNRALMSTLARWTEGVGSSGQSSETDMATGGADYVFFSPKDTTVTSSIGYGVSDANDATVTFDAVDLFTRLDFYANYVDTYGARAEENDNLKNAAPGGYELMFKDRVSTDMLKDIVVHTRVVPFLIKELKNRGITEINGRSVDEVVTVGGQGVVMEKEGAIKKFQTKLDENLKNRFGEDFGGAKKYKDWLNEDPSGRAKEYAPPVDENAIIAAVKDLNNEKQERVIVRLTNGAYLSYTRYTGAIGAPFTYEYQEIENDFPGWTYLTSDEQSKGSN